MTEEHSLVEDSKFEDKKDPIVDILTSLLHKYEALEKDSRVCKNDLKKDDYGNGDPANAPSDIKLANRDQEIMIGEDNN